MGKNTSVYWKGVQRKWGNVAKHFNKKQKTIKELKTEKEHLLSEQEAWSLKQQRQKQKHKLKEEITALKRAKSRKTIWGKMYYSEYHPKPMTKTEKKRTIKRLVKIYNSIAGE